MAQEVNARQYVPIIVDGRMILSRTITTLADDSSIETPKFDLENYVSNYAGTSVSSFGWLKCLTDIVQDERDFDGST